MAQGDDRLDQMLKTILTLRDQFDDEDRSYKKEASGMHNYRFNGNNAVTEKYPSGTTGEFELDGDVVNYTLDQVRDNVILRMDKSFDEIDKALSDNKGLFQ